MTTMEKTTQRDIVCSSSKLYVGVLMLILMLPFTAHAESGSASYPFSQGSARLSIFLGGGSAFNQNYTIFGLGGGYFVADGLEVGIDAETWTGNTPHIEQVSPQARYVFNVEGPVKPYAGAFYRRTHIESYRDSDSIGARAGAFFLAGGNAYFGAGIVQDNHLNCDRTVYAHCSEIYPELLFAILFR
jgi:hypothetical protein